MGAVYLFGAGASKAINSNAPLTAELLPQALDLLCKQDNNTHGQRIRTFIGDFYFYGKEDARTADNLPELEDILSQLDYAIEENRPLATDYPVAVLREIRESFVFAICEVLRQTLAQSSSLMNEFVESLRDDDTLISLNYELTLDNAVEQHLHRPIDYGIPVRRLPDSGPRETQSGVPLPLYKLHGSLNWLYCPLCQQITVTADEAGIGSVFNNDKRSVCNQCGSQYEAIIVTPTMAKSYANVLLNEVWREAEDAIMRADSLILVGYSMPDADVYLRCMLKRAVFANHQGYKRDGRPRDLQISVIDYDPKYDASRGNAIQQRYQRLFRAVRYHSGGFASYVKDLPRSNPH